LNGEIYCLTQFGMPIAKHSANDGEYAG